MVNIFGFGSDWDRARKPKERPNFISCNMHPGSILIKVKGEPMLQCRECGTKYPDAEYQDEAEVLATEMDELIKRNKHNNIVRKR